MAWRTQPNGLDDVLTTKGVHMTTTSGHIHASQHLRRSLLNGRDNFEKRPAQADPPVVSNRAEESTATRGSSGLKGWRKRLGVEPSPPAISGRRPILKTGRATGPRSLPSGRPRGTGQQTASYFTQATGRSRPDHTVDTRPASASPEHPQTVVWSSENVPARTATTSGGGSRESRPRVFGGAGRWTCGARRLD